MTSTPAVLVLDVNETLSDMSPMGRDRVVNRSGGPYPGYFTAPDATVRSVAELAERLG